MQIKIIMISILVACSYLIGEYIYKAYTKRHKQLNELIRILEIMRMDLAFGLYTLDEMFFRIGENKEMSFHMVFKNICKDLRDENNKTLESILDKNLKDMGKDTYLQDREIEELKNLILTLGKGDIESQERMIDLSISNLKKMTEESLEDINKKGNVYKKLSTIIGLVIGIFLM
ncbi:stage III sporulation protein AB [[Clostridium] sordellii]|uniref:stage III sporulation protein AB n=2 Tax=Paraclostridium sordellii TaxID=1505 RepID=UPI0005E087C9|nr:stage III sporulation protein AB [Paeniclostridium sordellii]MBS6023810.1 stage III sporulation protein AB [Paeniclostridium sordellii]MDU2147965.1 stage III sporulation protein AB [Paeniclostridium sordellii]RGX14125.1 stage III sporulation protein AB [Paeniclostridium sordellii]CEN89468.1 stage III sporulation protein AB [[Clostridium] sordellii] [Paeniclostridium sordellii]CEQ13182.1 stage III sporulation protein AB [[Clostridium] sordellii] [Paeniclostridium sordellii]